MVRSAPDGSDNYQFCCAILLANMIGFKRTASMFKESPDNYLDTIVQLCPANM